MAGIVRCAVAEDSIISLDQLKTRFESFRRKLNKKRPETNEEEAAEAAEMGFYYDLDDRRGFKCAFCGFISNVPLSRERHLQVSPDCPFARGDATCGDVSIQEEMARNEQTKSRIPPEEIDDEMRSFDQRVRTWTEWGSEPNPAVSRAAAKSGIYCHVLRRTGRRGGVNGEEEDGDPGGDQADRNQVLHVCAFCGVVFKNWILDRENHKKWSRGCPLFSADRSRPGEDDHHSRAGLRSRPTSISSPVVRHFDERAVGALGQQQPEPGGGLSATLPSRLRRTTAPGATTTGARRSRPISWPPPPSTAEPENEVQQAAEGRRSRQQPADVTGTLHEEEAGAVGGQAEHSSNEDVTDWSDYTEHQDHATDVANDPTAPAEQTSEIGSVAVEEAPPPAGPADHPQVQERPAAVDDAFKEAVVKELRDMGEEWRSELVEEIRVVDARLSQELQMESQARGSDFSELKVAISRLESQLHSYTRTAKSSSKPSFYPLTGQGQMLVFSQSADREGNEFDLARIKEVFGERLKLKIHIEKDLTAAETMSLAENLDERMGFSEGEEVGFLVVLVLAHGSREPGLHLRLGSQEYVEYEGSEFFMASDGKKVYLAEFLSHFTTNDRPTKLVGKPKIVFINCCRGDNANEEIEIDAQSPTDGRLQHDCPPPRNSYQLSKNAVATFQDTYVLRSTVSDTKSWRHPHRGTYFVQALCRVLDEDPTTEVEDLRMLATDAMERDWEPDQQQQPQNWVRQCLIPQVTNNTLRKKFSFVSRRQAD